MPSHARAPPLKRPPSPPPKKKPAPSLSSDSPFVIDNNAGGGFVGDKDVIALQVSKYESETSSGERGEEKGQSRRGRARGVRASARGRPAAPLSFCSHARPPSHPLTLSLFFLSGAGCVAGIYSSSDEVCIPLPPYAQRSGPRRTIYCDPATTTAAIVTCGGLCPGLNDVVQNIVFTLADYGVPAGQVYGVRYGLRGFYARGAKPIELSPDRVQGIHLDGGTILGTSRGGADVPEIVRRLSLWGVTQLFVVGGNGGNAAAHAIHEECERQGVVASVVGVPKSIDNDILLIDRCFG